MPARTAAVPVISRWAAISPYGVDPAAFRDGLAAARSTIRALPAELRGDSPMAEGGWVPDFDVQALLGRKGTRSFDRFTAFSVATMGLVLADAGPGLAAADPEALGIVLGTGHGSVKTQMDFTRETLVSAKPYHVDVASIPVSGLNAAAGMSAIRHTVQGPNVTVSGGALTGLLALNYAVRLLRRRHADAIIVGAVEEYSPHRAWLEHHSRANSDRQAPGPLGEGCAVLLVESSEERAVAHGRRSLAGVLASRFTAFATPDEAPEAVARAVGAALDAAGVAPPMVDLVVPADCGGTLGAAEDFGLRKALGGHAPREVRLRALIGDTSAASAAFQLTAAVLNGGAVRLALVTSVDPGGTAGATLLARPDAGS
ncbi:hypothetical protein Drose_26690 [Dactylosporangium roseum]|uniref:Beta-ketoacyl synthase-like N-terminal domain-containing protein n=1 Tax=Dactylosporangium roseum TaxID=47989 RepID=A0ABY5Z1N7_9ACTN|nr:beta-ketoacyl synthase N-terminal-like domain-containing protein [Dactylosporangium roseum]UWZ34767.1 hypothetical protein Drose_26690 [Dactylosporangium roseum]